jgi:hypothetical protein
MSDAITRDDAASRYERTIDAQPDMAWASISRRNPLAPAHSADHAECPRPSESRLPQNAGYVAFAGSGVSGASGASGVGDWWRHEAADQVFDQSGAGDGFAVAQVSRNDLHSARQSVWRVGGGDPTDGRHR